MGVFAAALAALATSGLALAAGPAEVRCSLADPRIAESSGVAAASWSDDVVFTHNDSGDGPRFFAVDARSCATRATFTVTGGRHVDWEDMTRGAAPDGSPVLWLADIGDNRAQRREIVIYEVAEPGAGADGAVAARARWTLTYPDGPRDAEALLVDPETGRPVVVTKDAAGGASRAYRVPASGSGVLEPLATLDVKALPGGGLAGPAWSVTAGATSPDRRRVVLRSYLAAWLWTTRPGEPLAATLARPPEGLELPLGRQTEALSFTRDGGGLWATSEGAASPLSLVPLTPLPPLPPLAPPASAEPGGAAAPSPAAIEPEPEPGGSPTLLTAAVAAAGAVLLTGLSAVLLQSARRRR